MKPDISTLFLSKVYTKPQSYRGIRVIKDFVNFIFYELGQDVKDEKFDLSVTLSEFEIKSLKRISNQYISEELKILRSFNKDFFSLFDKNNLNQNLKELENHINATKTIIIYVPFDMPDSELERLGVWVKKNLGSQTIFELSFDPSLIGGCALSYNGIFKDYSLRQKIKDNREKITQMLLSFRK